MNGFKISIIIPVYKVEKYIKECFGSLVNQTYQNIEIILVDDGSPDKSGALCDEFAAGRSDTIVIHQENAGVSVARNNGIEHASGDYILFVDPDDWIEKDCCERLIECVRRNDYDVIFFLDKELNEITREEIDRELPDSMELNKEDIKKLQYNTIGMNYRIFQFHSGTPWGKLFKREFIRKNNLRFTPGVVKAQDVLFNTQAYEQLDQAYILNYSGYIYRKNEGSSNIRFNPGIVKGTFLLIEGLGRIADLHPGDFNYQKSMAKICMYRINFIERLYLFNRNHVCTMEEGLRIYQEYLSLPAVSQYLKYYIKNDTDGFGDVIRRFFFNKKTLKIYYYILAVRYRIYNKEKVKMEIKRTIKSMWINVSPKTYIKYEYKKRFGVLPNLNSPENFNEKILWLIFNWQHPLIVQCADKYRMRKFVEDRGLGDILPKLYGVWEDANTIDWNSLPQEFVIKCNHGCKMNIICEDKDILDTTVSTERLDKWMHTNYGSNVYEPHYSHIKPIILAEEYIKNPGLRMPVDYKIYCFNGNPELVLACVEREYDVQLEWYDFEWNAIEIGAKKNQRKAKRPKSLAQMVEYSKRLCDSFSFVRIDFYERDGEPILGEFTFTPYFGMANYYSKEGCMWLGKKLTLPEPYHKHFK